MAAFILIGTIFTVIVAYPLKIVSESLMNLPYIVGIFLLITGCILYVGEWAAEKLKTKTRKLKVTELKKLENKLQKWRINLQGTQGRIDSNENDLPQSII